jgi:hypothetical protein
VPSGRYDPLTMKPRAASWTLAISSVTALLLSACSEGPPGPSPSPVGPSPAAARWRPTPGATWQWQLDGTVDVDVDAQVYDIDVDNSSKVVAALHARGRRVVCYFEAGTREDWRADAGRFPTTVLGNTYVGWPGERWLDIRNLSAIAPIMAARLDQCRRRGFDGVEFDSVAGFQENTGFPLTPPDQLRYNRWLAEQARSRGLAAGLKNDLDQVPSLVSLFDFEVDEQCFEFDECAKLVPFIAAGKAVFNAEYNLDTSRFCPRARALRFSSIRKRVDLGPWREACT